jgi:hypothetical protein
LGLTRHSFRPLVVSRFCRLCTRLSFRLACEMGGLFLGWSPAPCTVQGWVLGLRRPAPVYLSTAPLPPGDGEGLLIECDGQASATASDEELGKRRRPRRARGCSCQCPRHRGRCCRQSAGKKKKRKPGDKSKNGRGAVLIALDTLKRSVDGQRHGPSNKKVYASFSCRRLALPWARQQSTRRGLAEETTKTIPIIRDGEGCLQRQMRKLFPHAVLTRDIRHAQERLWKVGSLRHPDGSEELAVWVEPLAELLRQGKVEELLTQLEGLRFLGPGSQQKRKICQAASS